MTSVVFTPPVDGALPTLSPDTAQLAILSTPTVLTIYDVRPDFLDRPRPHARAPRRVGAYRADDAVLSIEWSPDGTLLLAVTPSAILVVSAVTLALVTSVATGVNGVRKAVWHLSSRAVLWAGHAQTFVVSLTDGTVMQLPCHAKVSGGRGTPCARNAVTLPPAGEPGTPARDAESRLLLRWSVAGDAFFVITPASIATAVDPAAGAPALSREVARIDIAGSDATLRVSVEALVVFCALTHTEVARFPASHLRSRDASGVEAHVTDIGDVAVGTHHALLHDTASEAVCCLHLRDGTVARGFAAVVTMAMLPGRNAAVLLSPEGEVRVASLLPTAVVVSSVTLVLPRALPSAVVVLTETPRAPDAPPSAPAAHYDIATADAASFAPFAADDRGAIPEPSSVCAAAWEKHVAHPHVPVPTHERAAASLLARPAPLLAGSPCGCYTAVQLPSHPSCVAVLRAADVVAVLRHRCTVTALAWRPPPPAPLRGGAGATNRSYDEVPGDAVLVVATDSHDSPLFLWTPAAALCAVPQQPAGLQGRGFRIDSVAWGANGSTLLLADTLRGQRVAATVRFGGLS